MSAQAWHPAIDRLLAEIESAASLTWSSETLRRAEQEIDAALANDTEVLLQLASAAGLLLQTGMEAAGAQLVNLLKSGIAAAVKRGLDVESARGAADELRRNRGGDARPTPPDQPRAKGVGLRRR